MRACDAGVLDMYGLGNSRMALLKCHGNANLYADAFTHSHTNAHTHKATREPHTDICTVTDRHQHVRWAARNSNIMWLAQRKGSIRRPSAATIRCTPTKSAHVAQHNRANNCGRTTCVVRSLLWTSCCGRTSARRSLCVACTQ